MANTKLDDKEVARRLTRLRNLEQLHVRDRAQIASLKAENKQLKAAIVALTTRFEALFQKQQIRIAELEKMVFGSRPKTPPSAPGADTGSDNNDTDAQGKAKSSRPAASFRRAVPGKEDITGSTTHPVTSCVSCGGPLAHIREHLRYIEDIVLPMEGGATPSKTAVEQRIQSGWCATCGTTTTGDDIDLRGQQVVLGENVRILTAYCMTVLDMSYTQLVSMFRDIYGLAVSSGELATIARKQARTFLPEKEAIAGGIRSGPGQHFDETSYTIASQGMGWAWCMGDTSTQDVIYDIVESRGGSHVKDLLGTNSQGVHIHDCYGAYKQLDAASPGQSCWSHYYRAVRDLAEMDTVTLGGEDIKVHCQTAHQELGGIYADLRQALGEPFDLPRRTQQQITLRGRIDWFCVPHPDDPKKLQDLKHRLQDWRHTLFTCLLYEGIPADNNKAERHLRKLVIKRKKSFGVRNPETAKTLSTLMSVVWTYKHRYENRPGQLLTALARVRG